MIRRNWMVLLVVIIAAMALAACGGQAQPTPVPTTAPAAVPTNTLVPPTPNPTATPEPAKPAGQLTIWADDTRAPVLRDLAQSFQDEYGLELIVQEVGFGDIRDQVKLAAPAGEGPDIFVGAHDWLGELVASGIVEPLELSSPDDFLPATVQAFSYEGQLYGMPYATENVAFFYNPDLVPTPPTTWDEVITVASQLEADGKVKQGWVMQAGDPYHFFPIQTAFGGYVFGVDANNNYNPDDVGLDSPGSLAAAEFLDQAVKDGHLVADVDWETMHVLFESGDAAMMISGPWSLPRIRESGISYAIAPIPGQTQEAQPFLGVQGFMVSAFSENKLLAEAFLNEFVATPEVMQAIFDADPRPSAFVSVRDAIDDPDLAAFAAAGANGLPMPAIPEMSAVWGAWGDAITLIFNQAEAPDTAFKNAAAQVREAIGAPDPTPTPEPVAEEPAPLMRADADLVIWADNTRAPVMKDVAANFQNEYGVTVAVQEVGFGDIRDQVKLAAPAGEGPDIFVGAHDWLGELVASGIVEPLELSSPDDFLPATVQAFSYEGQLYGMPYATENVAFFYNPDLVPTPPTTWDEVITVASQLEADGKVKQGWVMQAGDPYHFFPIQTAFGGYVFGVDANNNYNPDDVGLDSPGSLAAAEFLDQAVKDGHLVADVDWETMHVLFESGDAAMMISGPWSLPRIRESGISYAIAPIPGQTQEAQPFLGVQGFMVSAFSENKLLAEAFLNEFVATPEVMQAIFDADPRPSAFVSVRDAIDDPDLAAFAAAGANGLPMPAIPEMSAVWGAWGDAITLIFNQAEAPDTAFKNAAEQIRAAIAGG